MVLVHMTQVFLHGAYKYPRELTWIVGVVLLLCTLGMFFTGQVLRWDPDAYWGLAVGGSMAGRVPVVGPQVVQLVLGGPVIGGDTLSRFFALHVFIIPGVLLALLAVHLWLVLQVRRQCAASAGRNGRSARLTTPSMTKQLQDRRAVSGRGDAQGRVLLGLAVIVVVAIAASSGPRARPVRPIPTLAARTRGRNGRFCGCSRCCRSARPARRRSSFWCSR